MGRGAGNLCTELITKYLNNNQLSNYEILPLLKSIDNDLKEIYEKSPWGYSTPYYIAAIHGCHPNYAKYLVEKKLTDEEIDKIISKIPEDKKNFYDSFYIETLASF
jgi:4-hydroxy 2-oxovalerate aldolase